MTFAMSTEGDSVKSALSEANEKNATDNHTDDSSQDSVDAKETQVAKPVENNVGSEKEEKPKDESTEGDSEPESEGSEKKDEGDAPPKEEKKSEEQDTKSEEDEGEVKKDKKETKSEEDEEGGEEEEEEEEEEEKEKEPKAKKQEKPAKEPKTVKEPKEKEEKASTASEKDEEEEEAEDEEEEQAEEKPEKKGKKKGVPLLDQPLETSGKRERKNVERFEDDVKKEPAKVEFEEGSGTPLGEIPRVEASINRFRSEDLKYVHRLLFKLQGKKNANLKRNIRKFNGFAFEKDSDDYKRKLDFLKKTELKVLKNTCEVLDLDKSGIKDVIAERIMNFLMAPKDSGKPLPGTGRPKRASAVRANNRGYSSHDDYSSDDKHTARARRDKGKRANLKDDTSSDEEFKPGDASDASDEKPRAVSKRKRGRTKKGSSEEDEASLSGATSDESDDAPKSKRRKSVTKTNSRAKKSTGRKGKSSKGRSSAAAATPRRSTKRGRKAKDASSDEEEDKADEGSSSEDEPLVKKKAKTSEPPTDDEIKTFIKDVLEGANLEEITMKTVCQRVYDNYPDFDLTARKNFIKSTVKSLIST